MKNIKKYSLFESNLKLHSDIIDFLDNTRDSLKVSSFLYSLRFDKNATDTMNFLRYSNDDLVYFSQDSKFKNIDVNNFNWSEQKDKIKIGRVVSKLIKSYSPHLRNLILDNDIELFVNEWKGFFDKNNYTIKIVSGEEIRKWYLIDNYNKMSIFQTLGKSCMSHESCQDFLDIYVENPEVCQLLIQLDKNGRLLSRALLWKSNNNKNIVDRIYYTYSHGLPFIKSWISENLPDYILRDSFYGRSKESEYKIQLKKWKFDKYPYFDTFSYLSWRDGILCCNSNDIDNKPMFRLDSTNGSSRLLGYWRYSKKHNDVFNRDDCFYDYKTNDYLPIKGNRFKYYWWWYNTNSLYKHK